MVASTIKGKASYMDETWKPVKGYEGLYEVSSIGRVKRVARKVDYSNKRFSKDTLMSIREKILSPVKIGSSKEKYFAVNLRNKSGERKLRKVHRLVAEAFIPNPGGLPQIDHKDGNKNNNSVSNLEWVTGEENYRRALIMGLACSKGSRNGNAKLTDEQVDEIRKTHIRESRNFGAMALSRKYGVHRSTIEKIVKGESWKE